MQRTLWEPTRWCGFFVDNEMTDNDLTASTLELCKRDAAILQERIEADMVELARLKRKIRERGGSVKLRPRVMSEMSPVSIVQWILQQQDEPITQKKLRDMIAAVGYPMGRFGPACRYFYAIVKRLELKTYIHRNGDEVEWLPMAVRRTKEVLRTSKNINEQLRNMAEMS